MSFRLRFSSNACDFSKRSLGFLVLDGKLGHHEIDIELVLLSTLLLSHAFQCLQRLLVLALAHAYCRYGSSLESDTLDLTASWSGRFLDRLVLP